MTDKDTKIKSLEIELDNRHQQILGLEDKIAKLQQRIDQNADVVELSEKIKMLETQNVKLIEKNQSDVVEWKTREREFKQQLKLMQEELSTVKAQLDEANDQLKTAQPQNEESKVAGLLQTIRDLQHDHNDLRSINDKLLQNANQLSIQNESLKGELLNSEDQKQQLQLQIQDLKNKHNLELEQLRLLNKKLLYDLEHKDTLYEQQMANLLKLQSQFEAKDSRKDEDLNSITKQREELLLENDNLKKLNEKQLQEIQILTQQIKSQNQQITDKDKLIQELQTKVNNEHNQMVQQQQNAIKLENKLKEQTISFETSIKEKDTQVQDIKKNYEIKIAQIEKQIVLLNRDNAIILNQLQQTNDQNKELLRQIKLLETQCKEATHKEIEKDKKLVDALERMKKLDQELKALTKQNSGNREQIIFLESELSKVKEQNRLLQREKAEIKEKLDFLIAQSNRKGKLSEIEGLRKQVSELQMELGLLKESHKVAQTSLKSTMDSVSHFKGRIKKLDFENQSLLDSKLRLESLFQELLESTKTKKSVYRNLSEVSLKPQQSNMMTDHGSSILDPTSERLTSKTNTNQATKSGDVRSLFKRPIQVMKIRSTPKRQSQHDFKKSEQTNEDHIKQQANNNSPQQEESIQNDESQKIHPKDDSEVETL